MGWGGSVGRKVRGWGRSEVGNGAAKVGGTQGTEAPVVCDGAFTFF